jgi:hypothetical protein
LKTSGWSDDGRILLCAESAQGRWPEGPEGS